VQDASTQPNLTKGEVARYILKLLGTSLALTLVILALLWHLVGAVDTQSLDQQQPCWRCMWSVSMLTPDEGWAVGYGHQVLHYMHGVWTWQPIQSGGWLFSVAMASPTEGWAVGGSIIEYHAGRWTQVQELGGTDVLHTVVPASPDLAWAVGDRYGDGTGLLYALRPGASPQVYTFSGTDLSGVFAVSPDEAWAVGDRVHVENDGHYVNEQSLGGIILHYHNGAWSEAAQPEHSLRDISMTSPTDGWAVGTAVYRYTHGTWTQTQSLPGVTLWGVSMASATDGWAFGELGDPGSVAYHYADGQWQQTYMFSPASITGMSSPRPGEVWALGSEDADGAAHGVFFHYVDGTWTRMPIPRKPALFWDQVRQYTLLGLVLLGLFPFVWLLVRSFTATGRSIWRLWITRMELAGLVIVLFAMSLGTIASFLGDDLPFDPGVVSGVGVALYIMGLVAVYVPQFAGFFVQQRLRNANLSWRFDP
jgi:hypothetical protein